MTPNASSKILKVIKKAMWTIAWLNFISAVAFAAGEKLSNDSPKIDASIARKLDSSLLIEIGRLKEEAATSEVLKVIVRTKDGIDASQKKQLEEAGLSIDSVFGDIFTATGSYTSVIKTAGLDFVVYIELAKKLKTK